MQLERYEGAVDEDDEYDVAAERERKQRTLLAQLKELDGYGKLMHKFYNLLEIKNQLGNIESRN